MWAAFQTRILAAMAGMFWLVGSLQAGLAPQNVLVVVNTNSADSISIGTFYTNLHPGAKLVPVGTTTNISINRTDFNSQIRDPIRTYLNSTPGLATQIVSIVTTRGVPHQLHGNPSDQLFIGTADYASVDSELSLLWQNLVPGPTFSNIYPANTTILNPYYFQAPYSPISSFSRANIQVSKNWSGVVISNGFLVFESPAYGFNGNNAFGFYTKPTEPLTNRLTPGDIYLVTRLSGYSVTDVTNSLVRAQNIQVFKSNDVIVLNKNHLNLDAGSYALANIILTNAGFNVLFSPPFVVTNLPPGQRLLSFSTYGTYLGQPAGAYYIFSNNFTYANGSIFNSYESFNGVEFNNPANRPGSQGQVADWIRVGGTLGFGHVNEPFTFSVADEDIYLPNLLISNFTWAEAAYASLMVISWQNIILGDPLATFTIVNDIIPEPSTLLQIVLMGLLLRFGLTARPR